MKCSTALPVQSIEEYQRFVEQPSICRSVQFQSRILWVGKHFTCHVTWTVVKLVYLFIAAISFPAVTAPG